MKKIGIVFTVLILMSLVGTIFYHHNYNMEIESLNISASKGKLHLELATPIKDSSEKPGLMIFVHGDGPKKASDNGAYYPIWEELTKENIISLGWDKPGIGQSEGDWLEQSTEDRVKETKEIVNWAVNNLDIDEEKIGIWGADQAGWVVPQVLNENQNVSYAVLVSPIVNWQNQTDFETKKRLQDKDVKNEDVTKELEHNHQIRAYLEKNDYDGYINYTANDKSQIDKKHWDYYRKNMNNDATSDLKEINKPITVMIGDSDKQVDTKETESIYKKVVPENKLTINKIKNTDHEMLRSTYQTNKIKKLIGWIWNPRKLIAPSYLNYLMEATR